jgi:chromosomal replication initiation ATPase DnaA
VKPTDFGVNESELADALEQLGDLLLGLSGELREAGFIGSISIRRRVGETARLLASVSARTVRTVENRSGFSADQVLGSVAQVCQISTGDLVGRGRQKPLVRARMLATYIFHEAPFFLSFPDIGRVLGGRDHTTALHLYRRAYQLIELGDPGFKSSLRKVVAFLGQLGAA